MYAYIDVCIFHRSFVFEFLCVFGCLKHMLLLENGQNQKHAWAVGADTKTSENGWIAELAVLLCIIFEVLEPGAASHNLWGVVFHCAVLHISMTINKHQLSYFPKDTSHGCLV